LHSFRCFENIILENEFNVVIVKKKNLTSERLLISIAVKSLSFKNASISIRVLFCV